METWWERYPNLLDAEQRALDRAGYAWKIDETARQAGQLVMQVEYPFREGFVWNLRAEFPATYPYFAPTVILADVTLPRHHHPFGKNLCLLAQNGEDWRPQHDSLAVLLSDQLPNLVATASESTAPIEVAAEKEDHIGEPVATFLEYTENSVLIVPDDVPDTAHAHGRLEILAKLEGSQDRMQGQVHGLVSAILDPSGNSLVKLGATLPSHTSLREGYWMRLAKRPDYPDMNAFLLGLYNAMQLALPGFKLELMKAPKGKTLIIGFLFADETTWRLTGYDWVFLNITVAQKAQGRNALPGVTIRAIRADRGGEKSWMQRAPMLAPLRTKQALLFGAGSLGSSVALHLARAGLGGLTVIDQDYLQVGNTIRWALGWRFAGQRKVDALISYIRENYPYTEVDGEKLILGFPNFDHPSTAGPISDYEMLRERIRSVDVVIDAAASFRVSHFLSDLALELGKPYVWLTTTHGCAGGIVGRRIPGSGYGCWNCHILRLTDRSLPAPPENEIQGIQPGGCSQATFIGAGIDSEEIALMASRLAVGTLSQDAKGHVDFDWNVGICEVQRDGRPIAPSWHTSNLPIHPDCNICGTK
jgi:ubiquitin-protein ligase